MKAVISRTITCVCIGVLFYALISLGVIGYDYLNNRKVLAEARELYNINQHEIRNFKEDQQIEGEVEGEEAFEHLHEINEDIVGWLTIGSTNIDYPILQADDNEYYLNRNYKKEETRAGSLFFDYRNQLDGTDRHIITYGHRMRDHSMFSQLTSYLDKGFFKNEPEVLFDTVDGKYTVEVFAVYKTTTDFYYIETDFIDDDAYTRFIEQLRSRSLYNSDAEVTAEDTIITFSTCDYALDPTEGRLVVHGRIVERE